MLKKFRFRKRCGEKSSRIIPAPSNAVRQLPLCVRHHECDKEIEIYLSDKNDYLPSPGGAKVPQDVTLSTCIETEDADHNENHRHSFAAPRSMLKFNDQQQEDDDELSSLTPTNDIPRFVNVYYHHHHDDDASSSSVISSLTWRDYVHEEERQKKKNQIQHDDDDDPLLFLGLSPLICFSTSIDYDYGIEDHNENANKLDGVESSSNTKNRRRRGHTIRKEVHCKSLDNHRHDHTTVGFSVSRMHGPVRQETEIILASSSSSDRCGYEVITL